LDVSNNQLYIIDLSPLASCTNLRLLNLRNNGLSIGIDLSPLASCANLEEIDLCCNELTSIGLSPLASCTNLKALALFSNKLTSIDLSPLTSCESLRRLDLNGNRLNTIDLLPLWNLSLEILSISINDDLDSVSCAQVCDFIDEHPSCDVPTGWGCDR
ncbi:leucine-rich repeat protein, partial [bacterium]|nr:leucine-rich repeat protein [bacterium]